MNKSPAFQFYPSDWLSSPKVTMMTPAQEGAYIRLLCFDWDNNGIPDDDSAMAQLSRLGSDWEKASKILRECFGPHPYRVGFLTNRRLQKERIKQKEFRKERSKSGLRGAKKRWLSHSSAIAGGNGSAMQEPMAKNGSPSPSPSPNVVEREYAHRPTIDEVKSKAQMIGLAEWRAVDWYEEMEGCGWLDHLGRPISKWQPILSRVRTKWEADGRPMSPPANKSFQRPKRSRGPNL